MADSQSSNRDKPITTRKRAGGIDLSAQAERQLVEELTKSHLHTKGNELKGDKNSTETMKDKSVVTLQQSKEEKQHQDYTTDNLTRTNKNMRLSEGTDSNDLQGGMDKKAGVGNSSDAVKKTERGSCDGEPDQVGGPEDDYDESDEDDDDDDDDDVDGDDYDEMPYGTGTSHGWL